MRLSYLVFILVILTNSFAHSTLHEEEPALYSYIIGSINSDKIEAESNSDIYAIPASCLKVVTTLLAYKVLGKDFNYQTRLYKADNDYIIKFSGDPTFTSEKLKELLLPIQGKKIEGRLILDNSLFIVHPHSTNIIVGDRGKHYARPVSALIIDENFIHLDIFPTSNGKLAQVSSESGFEVRSELIIDENPSNITTTWEGDTILLKGNINKSSEAVSKALSPLEIDEFAQHKLKKLLKELSINAQIKIINDETLMPQQMQLVKAIDSETLEVIIPPALERSDNMVFDTLFLNIIHKVQQAKIKDWGEGNVIIKRLIQEYLGVDVEKAIIADGSGLSFYNRIQPKKLFEILKNNYTDMTFLSSMPKIDYINERLGEEVLPSYLRAKTGALLGFRCLCGYDTRANDPKAFVIMANSFEPLSKNINAVLAKFISEKLK